MLRVVSKVVGLTGGIGSGKSTVARLLAAHGARIIDADVLARQVLDPGSPALEAVRTRFGSEVFDANGVLDRKALGARVFGDPEARAALNAIVHPDVARRAMEAMAQLMAEDVPVIVYDVPLLYENGLDRSIPFVVVVHVPRDVQKARVFGRDGLSEAEIDARIAAQLPLDDKAKRAHHVIDNSGSLEQTEAQVAALWSTLSKVV